MDKTWVDFGMNAAQLRQKLHIGDTLTFCTKPRRLLGDKITAPALDNRCGVAALIRAAELIDTQAFRVILLFSSQEETFGTGAKTGAFALDPDEAIAVDVSFAAQPDVTGQYGKIELGKGPMICIFAGVTGTNGDHIAVSKSGVRTAVVSVPQRYMHTPVEVISLADVENTARLLAAYINSGGAFHG